METETKAALLTFGVCGSIGICSSIRNKSGLYFCSNEVGVDLNLIFAKIDAISHSKLEFPTNAKVKKFVRPGGYSFMRN